MLWVVAMGGCYGWLLIGACHPVVWPIDVFRPRRPTAPLWVVAVGGCYGWLLWVVAMGSCHPVVEDMRNVMHRSVDAIGQARH